jgi:hypothetical protein
MTTIEPRRRVSAPRLLPLKDGVNYKIEEEANKLLAQSRRGVTALSAKQDYLSEDQLRLRYQREIFNSHGVCDESLVCGLFRRAHNPLAGSRPSKPHSEDG